MKRQTLFSHLSAVPALAARILHMLGSYGRMGRRELKQRLHSWGLPHWEQAFGLLLRRGLIKLDWEGRKDHLFVSLVEIPEEFRPRIKPKRRKRRRPRTEWFEGHLPEFQARDRGRRLYLDP